MRVKKNKYTRHGMTGTRFYFTYNSLFGRCYNEKDKSYPDYGGRGIKVCREWEESFTNFYNDMFSGYSDDLTLDRIDVNKDYCKENCRWIPKSRQAQGTRKRKDKWTSKYKGVALQPSGLWLAQIQKDGEVTRRGPFVNEIDAALSYDNMAIELYGDLATTNQSLGLFKVEFNG